ncbi:NIPSNAP family protein [Pedobacter metabolipauper]|uniref:NIPSNAP protein n=1 Tax=Pedobacter metabolipauper TaxID=425513 RepID=A0A4R6SPM0_9SPHI|nr:NIPSNAP family protein [Pedobacter metabolipauper]TDQ06549.1 NIPSNAP protein [Pedobacter metabolipauper]
MKKISLLLLFTLLLSVTMGFAASKDFYQIKIYHLKSAAQEKKVEDFLQNAYLPALHRAGIAKAGVFKTVKKADFNVNTDERLIYVFIPFRSMADFSKLDKKLEKDVVYNKDGAAYLDAAYNETPYDRIETILLNAFDGNPHFNLSAVNTPKADRIYELRSYEGPTEKLYRTKLKMFNTGDEIGLFKRLGFNAVFYGEVIAGARMPNLMYLTTFDNKAARDAHWDAFGKDAYWKELSAIEEYKNTVSKSTITFLYPTDYSDI